MDYLIVSKEKIASALVRAREHAASAEEAHAVVAHALCVALEAVRDVDAEAAVDSEGEMA